MKADRRTNRYARITFIDTHSPTQTQTENASEVPLKLNQNTRLKYHFELIFISVRVLVCLYIYTAHNLPLYNSRIFQICIFHYLFSKAHKGLNTHRPD